MMILSKLVKVRAAKHVRICCTLSAGRLERDGRKGRIPYHTCVVDQRKGIALSTHCYCLWEVLARFGVRAKMVAVTRPFHDGAWAGVRGKNIEHAEWSSATQGLWLGSLLFSSLLCNVFLAASLLRVIVRITQDEGIVRI